jgi:hypothetical protein
VTGAVSIEIFYRRPIAVADDSSLKASVRLSAAVSAG